MFVFEQGDQLKEYVIIQMRDDGQTKQLRGMERREPIPKTFKRENEQDLIADWMWEVRERGEKDNFEVSGCVTGHYTLKLLINI